MDAVTLSRIQFAVTIMFHFIFVPLTVGIAPFIAIIETLYVRTGNEAYKTLAKFFGKLFTINFLLGIVTGLTMEFQFGTNWAKYAKFMGDIFGSPLAIEALVAFFLESTFISVWVFGWKKVSKKAHAFAAWMIALGTHLSAMWIIIANGFMQHPVGYIVQNGRAEMTDFGALVANPYAWHEYFHTVISCWTVAGFFVLGVSAYHLLRRQQVQLFLAGVKVALVFALAGTMLLAITGDMNGKETAQLQPTKLAAMEGLWDTESGASMYLLQVPDSANQRNSIQALPIPKLMSFLAYGDPNATVKGLKEFPADQRPPVGIVFWSFRFMIAAGVYLLLMAATGVYLYWKKRLVETRWFLKLLTWTIPLPYLTIFAGWAVTEVGRQPWTVYGLMRTVDSVSPVPAIHVLLSLIGLSLLYTILGVLDITFMMKYAKQVPTLPPTGQEG